MPAFASGRANPIVAENRHAGTDRWDIPWAGYQITDDRRLNIKGYATATSVLQGGTIGLRITTARQEPYTIDVYRLGYYDGKGGRHIAHLGPFAGSPQPACITVPSHRHGHLSVADVGTASRSRLVDIRRLLRRADHAGVALSSPRSCSPSSTVAPAGIVYMSSVNTYQAYNNFPYDPPAGVGWNDGAHPAHRSQPLRLQQPDDQEYPDGRPAVKVSFDRPYCSQYGNPATAGSPTSSPS